MLDCKELASRIFEGNKGCEKGICIVPEPNLEELKVSGEASVSLRLGRWFVALRHSSQTSFDVLRTEQERAEELKASKKYFVRFGGEFVLHPGRFVLASTLEWIRLPTTIGAYVGGKSSWARRGLIIETAAGIHPGFNGCLTLELANVGEIPIKIRPGMKVCQVFMHSIPSGELSSAGPLTGRRRPYLGEIKQDKLFLAIAQDKL